MLVTPATSVLLTSVYQFAFLVASSLVFSFLRIAENIETVSGGVTNPPPFLPFSEISVVTFSKKLVILFQPNFQMTAISLGEDTKEVQDMADSPKWLFARAMQESMVGHSQAIVAGSACLHAYLQLLTGSASVGFVPDDFDIFVGTTKPETTITTIYDTINNFFLEHSTSWFCRRLTTRAANPTYSRHPTSGQEIVFWVDFFLYGVGVEEVKIQVIVIKVAYAARGFLQRPSRFAIQVISGFDVSVCRVACPSPRHPGRFQFFRRKDSFDAVGNEFEFHFRKGTGPEVAFARLQKYMGRGFNLTKIHFEGGGRLSLPDHLSGCTADTVYLSDDPAAVAADNLSARNVPYEDPDEEIFETFRAHRRHQLLGPPINQGVVVLRPPLLDREVLRTMRRRQGLTAPVNQRIVVRPPPRVNDDIRAADNESRNQRRLQRELRRDPPPIRRSW